MLINCNECAAQISDEAKACPQCGAVPARAQKISPVIWVAAVLFGLYITSVVLDQRSKANAPPQTPQQAAASQREDAAVQRAANGAVVLKNLMRDPDSFKLESALVVRHTGAVCYQYRAKNGFGGITGSMAVLAGNGSTFLTSDMSGFGALWQKECAGKSGTQAATAIRWHAL